jgi:hypothetical protein
MTRPALSALAVAEAFLRQELAHGPRHGVELIAEAQARGVSPSTLAAAKRSVGIRSRRESWGPQHSGAGRWVWELDPEQRRRELRERLLEHLGEAVERSNLDRATRAQLKRIRNQLAREGLAELGETQIYNRRTRRYDARST